MDKIIHLHGTAYFLTPGSWTDLRKGALWRRSGAPNYILEYIGDDNAAAAEAGQQWAAHKYWSYETSVRSSERRAVWSAKPKRTHILILQPLPAIDEGF